MNTIDQLQQLGFQLEKLQEISPHDQEIILSHFPKLHQLGLDPASITQIAIKNTEQRYMEGYDPLGNLIYSLCECTAALREIWNISNVDLIRVAGWMYSIRLMNALTQNNQLRALYTLDEILNSTPHLLIELMSHLEILSSLGIPPKILPIFTKVYPADANAQTFLHDAEVLLGQLKLTPKEWQKIIDADHQTFESYVYLNYIIQCHQKLLKLNLCTKEQIIEMGMKIDRDMRGRYIESICRHYEDLIWCGMLPNHIARMISAQTTHYNIDDLISAKKMVKKMQIPSEVLFQIMQKQGASAIDNLVKCRKELHQLGLTAEYFFVLSSNASLIHRVRALEAHRDELTSIGITSPEDLASLASCPARSQVPVDKFFDRFEEMKRFQITSVPRIVKFFTVSKLPSFNTALRHSEVLILKWRFNADEILILIQRNSTIIEYLVENYEQLKNISRTAMFEIIQTPGLPNKRSLLADLIKVPATVPSNASPTTIITLRLPPIAPREVTRLTTMVTLRLPLPAPPSEVEQLKSVIQVQSMALAELTLTNQQLANELEQLRAELRKIENKRSNTSRIESDGFDLLDDSEFELRKQRNSFFSKM